MESLLKANIKKVVEESRRKAREQRAFDQILSKKLETTRRQAHAKEMDIQVKKQARERVRAKFSPKKHEQLKEDILRGLPA